MVYIGVVDDDLDFLGLIKDVLDDCGWHAICCDQSTDAYAMLRSQRLDALILDIRIESPTTGWEILSFVESQPSLRDLPIIVCSGCIHEMRDRADWMRERGISVLNKPFNLAELFNVIHTALPVLQVNPAQVGATG